MANTATAATSAATAAAVIQVSAVKKAFRQKPVLDGLDLTVQKGEICGLLGPNGSGKTTLLKVIAGLTHPQGGEVQLFGEPFRASALRRVGAVIERPGLYGGKSAAENLLIHQTLLGLPEDRVNAALAQVGLEGEAGKRVSKLSTGQRQRLGIAMALLGSPDLLILDEPVNSLDTQGMVEIRTLLQTLHRERGITILITSHLLDEVARIATGYAILKRGRVTQYTAAQVREQSARYAEIITDKPHAALLVLDEFVEGEGGYAVQPDGSIHLYRCLDRIPQINAALVEAGIPVSSLTTKSGTLADFYLNLTEGEDDRA